MSQINNTSVAKAITTAPPKPKAEEKKEEEAVVEKKKPVSKVADNKDISEA